MSTFLDRIEAEGLTIFGQIQLQTKPPKVRAGDCRAAMKLAKKGMVVCRKYNYYLDGHFIPNEFTHSGIMVSDEIMVHAISDGVQYIDILDFIKDADGFAILTPNEPFNLEAAVAFAKQQLGKPYDFKFDGGNTSAFFCHELTAKSLAAGGIIIQPIYKHIGPIIKAVFLADQFIERLQTVYAVH